MTMGWILFCFPVGLCIVSNPGRMARRSDRSATALTSDRHAVELLHVGDCVLLERGFYVDYTVLVRSRGSGAFPIATRSLSRWMLPIRARLCARRNSRRIAAGRCIHAADRGLADRWLRLADAVLCVRLLRCPLGGGLVFLLSRYSARARVGECRRARSDPRVNGSAFEHV